MFLDSMEFHILNGVGHHHLRLENFHIIFESHNLKTSRLKAEFVKEICD